MKEMPRQSPGLGTDLVRVGKAGVHRSTVNEGNVKRQGWKGCGDK